MQFRDLSRQYLALKDDIDHAIMEVVASGSFIMGAKVDELESALSNYVGVKHCVSCASGTDALLLALRVWQIGPGDAVFVPDFTFFASAEVIAQVGATPVFVDVEADTFNISVTDLEDKIRRVIQRGQLTPKVIIAVDLFGLPANYQAITHIAKTYDLFVLEDAAQGFGGSIASRRQGHAVAGSFGDIATTSFFPSKPLACYGDGGALFTDNDDWAQLADSYRQHGKGSNKYDNVRIGMNSRLDAIQAAVLMVKLGVLGNELSCVNEAARHYTDLLGDAVQVPTIPDGYRSSWAQYTIRLRSTSQREQVRGALAQRAIPSQIYYPTPLHRLPAFAYLGVVDDVCPVSVMLSSTVLSLPMHPYITADEVAQVAMVVVESL